MSKIKAKAISDQYWILQHKNKKIGQVTQSEEGYSVKINGKIAGTFTTLTQLKEDNNFEFTEIPKPEAQYSHDVHGYPTNIISYNAVWNVRYKLPLFTLEPSSKSWHAAGWYYITINNKRRLEFCPKLIMLQRNKYEGPYKEEPISMFDQLYDSNK